MRNPACSDVWKVWLYPAAALALGAWISPLLYNAGKALAEVSSNKITNAPLNGLAGVCRGSEFPPFDAAGLVLAAVVRWFPWREWLHARHRAEPDPQSWRLRFLDGAGLTTRGQPLRQNPQGLRQAGAGFLWVAGLWLAPAVVWGPVGACLPHHPHGGLAAAILVTMAGSLGLAAVLEVFFRGVALGVFLNAMRPAAALVMSALLFALVLMAMPVPGETVADPEAAGTGFEMLRLAAWRFAAWPGLCGQFAPLLALGGLLAYARWRTASLWLPGGLHAGWLFAHAMPATSGTQGPVLSATLTPLAGLLLAGWLTHYLTANPSHHEPPART